MGVALLMHSTVFFTTNYFGQIIIVWYLLLAMIGSMHALESRTAPAAKAAAAPKKRIRFTLPPLRPEPVLRLRSTIG